MIYNYLSSVNVAWIVFFIITILAIVFFKTSKNDLFQKLFNTAFYYSQALMVILFVFLFFGYYSEHFRDFLPYIATCCGLLFICYTTMSHILNESGKKTQAVIQKLLAIFFLFDMLTTFFF